MATDPRRLRPGALCRLLNSTSLGEILSEATLRRHRSRAGLRLGEGPHIDLLRYVAWLVQQRHSPRPARDDAAAARVVVAEAAQGAAALGNRQQAQHGHGEQLTARQEALLAALLTEPTHLAAAARAGVSPATLYRWLRLPAFRAAHHQARRALVDAAVSRLQARAGQAVDTLVAVACQGRRDGDRLRAALALLDHAHRGLAEADLLYGPPPAGPAAAMDTAELVRLLTARLRQVQAAELPAAEKTRQSVTLADALLRALGVDEMARRLEAIEAVLTTRKGTKR
jgi:hypothetical protein